MITIDWKNKIIFVPKTESVLIQSSPTEIRQLDLNEFRLKLKDLEDDAEGMSYVDTHRHNPSVTVSGAILARVVEIINGYTVTFEDGNYAINLVGANSNVGDVVNVNMVSVRSSNSAGLQDLNSLQAASFAGGVAINALSTYTGTTFPVGTRQYPVNNLNDAISIATQRGLKNIFIASPLTIADANFSAGVTFVGENINIPVIIDASANIANCEFNNLTLSGVLDNNNLVRECAIAYLNHIDGILYKCGIIDTISITSIGQATLIDCYSIVPSQSNNGADIDLSTANGNLVVRRWSGNLEIKNCSVPIVSSIDVESGTVTIHSSVTNGNFIITGGGTVVNNSTGSAVVTDNTSGKMVTDRVWDASISNYSAPGSIAEKLRKNLPR